MAVAVSDMRAECLNNVLMLICMKRFADDQIFFREFFTENLVDPFLG